MRSLVTQVNPHLAETLLRSGVAVHVIDPPSWDDFESYLTRLGEILGTGSEEARSRLKRARAAIKRDAEEAAGKNSRKVRVFLEATSRELHTCSPLSWAARLIELAGGDNVASGATPLREGSPLAAWGVERLLAAVEDGSKGIDVYLVQRGSMNAATVEEVAARPWFATLGARMAVILENLLSRPSLLGLEEGGKILIEIFYGGK
jgi:iron complex transport system substrate-binding protein